MTATTAARYHLAIDGTWKRCSAKSEASCPLTRNATGEAASHVDKNTAEWLNTRKAAVDKALAEAPDLLGDWVKNLQAAVKPLQDTMSEAHLTPGPVDLKPLAKKWVNMPQIPYGPRPGRKTIIVGFSGKMGAGKDYLSGKVKEALGERGAEIGASSFAAPLKGEMNQLIARYTEDDQVLADDFDIPLTQIQQMKAFIRDDYAAKGSELNAYDRTPGMRAALQYLGTDVRRAVNDSHWVDLYHGGIDQDQDFSFVTDVRFPNEADSIVRNGGIMIRLEPSAETLKQRAIERDGFAYNTAAHQHPSEVALDGYGHFDITLPDGYNVQDVVEQVQRMRDERIAAEDAAT